MSAALPVRTYLLTLAALAALPVLSGCVAVAIPVVAGTLVGKRAIDGKHRSERAQSRTLAASSDAAPALAAPALPLEKEGAPPAGTVAVSPAGGAIVRTAEFNDGSRVEVTVPARNAAPLAASAPAFVPAPASRPLPRSADPAQLAETARPASPPASATGESSALLAARGSGDASSYATFARYAGVAGNVPVIGTERHSAMLANPAALSANTRMCSIQPAAVMVDLDPAGSTFDPLRATRADPSFAEALAKIRDESVIVAWVSSATADKAGLVRKALVGSGLDPAGKDELVLLRFPEERKQTRRSDLAKELCIVAIAGDERADFDELFEYLKEPALARDLESLIGNGWFLIPQPLTAN